MKDSMALETPIRPRVGVPWRTAKEEQDGNRPKIENYYRAVREAGGEPVPVSLLLPDEELAQLAHTLDAVVLPGSPADVDPGRYGERPRGKCASADPQRERADYALLDYAFAARKSVLAICFGTQLLNVYLKGSLIQDIPSELGTQFKHDREGLPPDAGDPRHPAHIAAPSKLAKVAERAGVSVAPNGLVEVNSSHHQSVRVAGPGLRITAIRSEERRVGKECRS